MSTDAVNRSVWGPKLWRMYHLVAELSDRTDVILLWKSLLRHSSEILPCELCRRHLATYLTAHANFISRTIPKKGDGIRLYIRSFLLAFHNDVNRRLEKPELTEEGLTELYGIRSREETLTEVRSIYNELRELWQPLVGTQIHGIAFTEWKKVCTLLFALVAGGAN